MPDRWRLDGPAPYRTTHSRRCGPESWQVPMSIRYYLYISDTKLDMLLPQIDPALLRRRSSGWGGATADRLLADGLSNQALSMLDLGFPDRAEQCWTRALAADPHHLPTVYNLGLHRWRSGRTTDIQFVAKLAAARSSHDGSWLGEYLLALVELERGDSGRAQARLAAATDNGAPASELAGAAELARRPSAMVLPTILRGPPADWLRGFRPVPVAISADGSVVAAAGADGNLLVWQVWAGTPPPAVFSGPARQARAWSMAPGAMNTNPVTKAASPIKNVPIATRRTIRSAARTSRGASTHHPIRAGLMCGVLCRTAAGRPIRSLAFSIA